MKNDNSIIIFYCGLLFGFSILLPLIYYSYDVLNHMYQSEKTEGQFVKYKKKRKGRTRTKHRLWSDGYKYAPIFSYSPIGEDTTLVIQDKFGDKKRRNIGDSVTVYYKNTDYEDARLLEQFSWWNMFWYINIGTISFYFGLQGVRGKIQLKKGVGLVHNNLE